MRIRGICGIGAPFFSEQDVFAGHQLDTIVRVAAGTGPSAFSSFIVFVWGIDLWSEASGRLAQPSRLHRKPTVIAIGLIEPRKTREYHGKGGAKY